MNLLQLRTRVSEFLEDTGFTQWSAALIDQYLNDGMADFAKQTKCYRRYSSALSASATTPANAFYTLPSDLHELESVWVNGYHVPKATAVQLPYQWDTQTAGASSQPTAYVFGDFGFTELRFWPYPASAAYTTARVYYTALPATMSLTTSTPTGIPDQYHLALVYYAVAQCYRRNFEDADRAKAAEFEGMYRAQLDDCLARVTRLLNADPSNVPYRHL